MPDLKQTLDIPQGVFFSISDNSLILGNESDVVIRGDLGYKLKKVFSNKGAVQLFPPEGVELVIEQVEAPNGEVFISGKVECKRITGKKIHFNEGALKAESIKASEEVALNGKQFNVYFVEAPHVQIDGDSNGMALVIKCRNEIPKKKFTGGFKNLEEAKSAFDNLLKISTAAAADSGKVEVKSPPPPAGAKPQPAHEEKAAGGTATEKMTAGADSGGGMKKDTNPPSSATDADGVKTLFRRRL